MQLTRMTKLAIVTTGLVLGGAASAAAIAAPEAADQGRATGSEKAGFEVPVGPSQDEGDDTEVEETETPEATPEVDDEVEGDGDVTHDRKDNHGAVVSTVAQDDTLTGREHGEAVSEIARSDAGKPEQAANGKAKGKDREGTSGAEEEPSAPEE